MKHRAWMWGVFFIFLSATCASKAASQPTRANLACIKITPSVATGRLARDTVIEATLKYSIDLGKLKKKRYAISLLFSSSEGPNSLFNKKKTRLGEADLYLEKPSGNVTMKYPMDAVWNDPRLKRPVSIVFYIIEYDGKGTGQAIATAGPFIFRSMF